MDYSGLPGTLSFTPTTDRTQCLTIQIEDDAFPEETETILLLLSGSVNGAPIQAQATVLILDNDGMLEINVPCKLVLMHAYYELLYRKYCRSNYIQVPRFFS